MTLTPSSQSDPTVADLADRLHLLRQVNDPEHDRVSCWCCCIDCDFDYMAVNSGTGLSAEDIAELDKLS